jgi:hypothetical protein
VNLYENNQVYEGPEFENKNQMSLETYIMSVNDQIDEQRLNLLAERTKKKKRSEMFKKVLNKKQTQKKRKEGNMVTSIMLKSLVSKSVYGKLDF